MKSLFYCCTYIFLFGFFTATNAHSSTWLVKSPTGSDFFKLKAGSCRSNLLNPHLGKDIFEVICPNNVHPINAEISRAWKIFSQDKKSYVEPRDPLNSDQWGLEAMNIRSFWQGVTTGDKRIKVAVIDTGINYLHEDLQSNLAINTNEIPKNGIDDDGNGYIDDYYGWDAAKNSSNPTDELEHGSHVAGVIGATSNNDLGITGINWNVSIIPIKFIDEQGGGRTEAAIRAIDYAVVRGAQIINMSWGGTSRSPLLEEVMERCRAKGILFIAAAGNESRDNDLTPTYPASYPLDNVVSVAAINLHRELSWFSNWGQKSVHVAAPGESILSTTGGNRYGYKDGTSMAVPHITGAAALVWSAHPEWNYLEVKKFIINHCAIDNAVKVPVQCQGYFSF